MVWCGPTVLVVAVDLNPVWCKLPHLISCSSTPPFLASLSLAPPFTALVPQYQTPAPPPLPSPQGTVAIKAITAHRPGPSAIQVDGHPAYNGVRGMRVAQVEGKLTLLTGGADGTILLWDVVSWGGT